MPTFWVGILLVTAFSVKLSLFPSEGPQGGTVASAFSQPGAMVLPVATLSIITIAQYSRFIRAAAIDNCAARRDKRGEPKRVRADVRADVEHVVPRSNGAGDEVPLVQLEPILDDRQGERIVGLTDRQQQAVGEAADGRRHQGLTGGCDALAWIDGASYH